MSKLLGLTGLFILTRELTKGVSPKTVVPSTPTNNNFGIPDTLTPESEADRFARQKRLDEERRKREKAESDRIAAEEKKRLDNEFFKRQAEIKANPPDCGSGRSPRLRGAGTREFPYSWECILTGF